MRTKKGQSESSVMQRLLDEPYRFEFFQAIRLLLVFLRQHGVPNERALARILRFESSTALNFPASEIEDLRAGGEVEARTDRMLVLAAADASTMRIHITPAFIGFLGTCGALPYHYSERIATHRQRERSASARAFIELFSHRLIGQLYEAWEKYRLENSLMTGGYDRLRPIMLSLAGAREGQATFAAGNEYAGGQALAFYAALFRTRPASGFMIGRVLTEYFGVPITIEEFVGAWDAIPETLRTRLGELSRPRLASGATAGTRLWRHDRRVCLHVGPVDSKDLDRFLPRRDGAVALGELMGQFDVGQIEVEVHVAFKRECVRRMTLTTSTTDCSQRLGWTTFVTSRVEAVSCPNVRYMLELG